MPDRNAPTFSTSPAAANRARQQGLGEGQRELDAGRDPSRRQAATNPEQRSFEGDIEAPAGADRPGAADFSGKAGADAQPEAPTSGLDDRNAAGLDDVRGDLGAGTPPNVDVHKLGQEDKPQEDWGEPAAEGATFSSTHTRRGEPTEAQRGQGAKTRRANKDIVSRRT
jgi:hypothetical protein